VFERVAAPVTAIVLDRKTLPVMVVFVVLATIVVTVALPLIVRVENDALGPTAVLPLIRVFDATVVMLAVITTVFVVTFADTVLTVKLLPMKKVEFVASIETVLTDTAV
jgi:hypothetical protein